MELSFRLLQLPLLPGIFTDALISLVTAFVITLLCMHPLIYFLQQRRWVDVPDARKLHQQPIPTMGGIAVFAGLSGSLVLWMPLTGSVMQISFFFSLFALLALGILDDRKNLSARYKFVVQSGLALLMALSGLRIESFGGLFGIHDIPVSAQYSLTVLAIVGITNAFNLIDGIDGLAGGLGFMSLAALGILLTWSGDAGTALICFALAGGLLAFLYFNLNPARIFMGDTGSLVLGFVIAVMCLRLLQVNAAMEWPVITHSPVVVLGIVLIPVWDTLRVFATRMWKGLSPFSPDKTHVHHLLTSQGFSHGFAAWFICLAQAVLLLAVYQVRHWPMEWILACQLVFMLLFTRLLQQLGRLKSFFPVKKEEVSLFHPAETGME